MNLNLLILFPLITALGVLTAPNAKTVRASALAGAAAQLVLALALFCQFTEAKKSGALGFLFQQNHSWFPGWGIGYHIGVDGTALAMILLTSFVVIAGVLMSWNVVDKTKEFFFQLVLLSLGAYGFFISLDLFLMFFFLEIAVIPKYLLIGIWGSGKKEYAANKLALMLMGGSALILVGMLGAYFSNTMSFDFFTLGQADKGGASQHIFFPMLFLGFGVFTALFPFYSWVPDGHSSAPTAGSMFLAGISMKLGGYGCLRVATTLMPVTALQFADGIIILSVIGIVLGSFATLMQKDIKYMNAYSSVAHCGFVTLGIGMLTKTALTGAVMQMVSHGLMTALFFAVIGIMYERTHTRQLKDLGGLMKVMPFAGTAMFIAGFASLGLPGLSGFVAEMTVFIGSWEKQGMLYRTATVLACASIVVTAVYILRAVTKTMMGPLKAEYANLSDARWNEKLAVIILVAGILAMGLAPQWLNHLIGNIN